MERKPKSQMEDWKVAALLMLGLWVVIAASDGQVEVPLLLNDLLLVVPIGLWIVMTFRGRRSKKVDGLEERSDGD